MAGGVAQGVGPEFKPWNCIKKKKMTDTFLLFLPSYKLTGFHLLHPSLFSPDIIMLS
jgi:hypothetical protein